MRVVNSLSDSCTGIGVVADFAAVVLIRHGLHVWHDNTHRKIELLHSLQEVSGICKIRNQFREKGTYAKTIPLAQSYTITESCPWRNVPCRHTHLTEWWNHS